jgi:signal transduction histidine kinase
MIGHSFFDLMPADECERLSCIFSEIVQKHEKIIDLDRLNIHKNGKAVRLRSNGVPVFSSNGELLGYRGVDKDINEQKAMNDLLIRNQKINALEKLASSIAHDFNNLLVVIIGYAELITE